MEPCLTAFFFTISVLCLGFTSDLFWILFAFLTTLFGTLSDGSALAPDLESRSEMETVSLSSLVSEGVGGRGGDGSGNDVSGEDVSGGDGSGGDGSVGVDRVEGGDLSGCDSLAPWSSVHMDRGVRGVCSSRSSGVHTRGESPLLSGSMSAVIRDSLIKSLLTNDNTLPS